MEEAGLSHIINSEGEKLQYVLGTLTEERPVTPTIDELLEVNESVKGMLDSVSTNQMFLFGKMSAALGAFIKSKDSGKVPVITPTGPSGPELKPGLLGVVITSDKGRRIGNHLFLPQNTTAELSAIVITSGDSRAAWTHSNPDGFEVSTDGRRAVVKVSPTANLGNGITLKAASMADGTKYDTVTIVVTDITVKDVRVGGDGKLYADYGDNTFKEISADGTVTGEFICGGTDRMPGTDDDRDGVIVTESGVKYLGPNPDKSYQKAGPDGLLGTEDDEYVWQSDGGADIAPCNETNEPPDVTTVRNVKIEPNPAEVTRGGEMQFSATVYMSDGNPGTSGVTWSVTGTDGGAAISSDGLLTAGQSIGVLYVTAVSVEDGDVKAQARVTVVSSIADTVPFDGRILPIEKTGDSVPWIEIAQNGSYSLIVRQRYINVATQFNARDLPRFQHIQYGNGSSYEGSSVRANINAWFKGDSDGDADRLPETARMRGYTVRNNAAEMTGTGAGGPDGVTDSISKPIDQYASTGNDIAFALSYAEAANFASKSYSYNGGAGDSKPVAVSNWNKLTVPDEVFDYAAVWLRSPGSVVNAAATVSASGSVYQSFTDGTAEESAFVQPALWVDSKIFD
jgi:hypothetical protein